MNNKLFDFYCGNATGPRNLTLDEILTLSHGQFEDSHNFIQWLFPLPEPSKHNKDAPLLDDETITAMKENETCQANLKRAFLYFEKFLQETKEVWVTPKNHNFLRITRAIRSLKLLNLSHLANVIYFKAFEVYLDYPDIVGENTLKFWNQALNLEIPGSEKSSKPTVWVIISGVDFEDCQAIQKIFRSEQAALTYIDQFLNSSSGWERNTYRSGYEWCKGSDYIRINEYFLEK